MRLAELQKFAALAALFFPHCVVGGGAVRDAFLGAPIKDIDLFVDARGVPLAMYDKRVADFVEAVEGRKIVTTDPSIGGPDSCDVQVQGLPTIQVLAVNRCVFADVFSYDFGVSSVLMTPGGILRTAAFDSDIRQGVITYLDPEGATASSRMRSALRLQRLRRKYPDREPVNCERLLDLVPT